MMREKNPILTVSYILAVVLALTLLGVPAPTPKAFAASLAPETFADIAQKYSPAVVNISTQKTFKSDKPSRREFFGPGPMPGPGEPFWDFFEKFFPEMPRDYTQRSLGTGFIIDPKGLVITNEHVVKNADKIKVKMAGEDGKEYTATVKGRDPLTDIALLQIDSKDKNFPYLTLGDSDKIRVGDWVVAIGNPFGLERSISHGLISAKERVLGVGAFDDFLQTDALINPGNSGGPLFNMRGEVIGVATAVVTHAQGIGFAVPINMVKDLLPNLLDNGHLERGWLGLTIAEQPGADGRARVAVVQDVIPASPAAAAGLRPGDRITHVNGRPFDSYLALLRKISLLAPGTLVRLTTQRGGGPPRELAARVGEPPAQRPGPLPEAPPAE